MIPLLARTVPLFLTSGGGGYVVQVVGVGDVAFTDSDCSIILDFSHGEGA